MIYTIRRFLTLCFIALCLLLTTTTFIQSQQAIFSVPVSIDGVSKSLDVLPGQSMENAAFDFARNNNLFQSNAEEDINNVVGQLVHVLQTKLHEHQRLQQQNEEAKIAFKLPIQLDNMNTEIKIYNEKTIEESIKLYFDEYGISNEVRMNIAQQLVDTVQAKVMELQNQNIQQQQQQQQEPMFSIPITIDNQQVTIQHYENGNPFDEARSVCLALGITSVETLQNIIPQIANVIQKRIDEMMIPKSLVFSLPITMDGKEVFLSHYAEQTARDSVIQFFQSQNINDNEVINRYGPSLINMIETYLQENSITAPIISLPVDISGKYVTYNYFENADPQRSIMDFLQSVGITNQAQFQTAFNQLLSALQERLAALKSTKSVDVSMNPQNEGRNVLAVLPVSLANNIYNLQLFDDQKPEDVANWFCTDNWAIVKKQLGEAFTNDDLLDCISVIHNNLIAKLKENGIVEDIPSTEAVEKDQQQQEQQGETSNVEVSSENIEGKSAENIVVEETEKTVDNASSTVTMSSDNLEEVIVNADSTTTLNNQNEEEEKKDENSETLTVIDEEVSIQSVETVADLSSASNIEKKADRNENIESKESLKDTEKISTMKMENQSIKKENIFKQSGKPLKPLKIAFKKELVFDLDIDLGDDQFAKLSFYKGDKPSSVAEQFCKENNIDEENIPALLEMIQIQLDQSI